MTYFKIWKLVKISNDAKSVEFGIPIFNEYYRLFHVLMFQSRNRRGKITLYIIFYRNSY